jgi:photosystem II stability/assembly factor-like uncharacterized protein
MRLRYFTLALVFFLLSTHSDLLAQIRWTQTMKGQNKVVNFRPGSQGKVVYAVPHDSIGSIHISWDGGYHWARIKGSEAPIEPQGRSATRQLWLDPLDSNNVLLGSSDPHTGIYRSSDAGYNWQQALSDVVILGESIFEVSDGSGTLYCGASGIATLWKSTNRGVNWDSISVISDHNPNICVIAGKPGSSTDFLVGTGGGSISKTTDGGKTWREVHPESESGMSDVPMIQFDPLNPDRVWATLYFYKDRSVLKSIDAGETWKVLPVVSNQWALKVNPANPNELFMGRFQALDTVGGTFFRSKDGGESWEDLGMDSIIDVWQIDYDTASGRLAMATSNGIFIGETRQGSVSGDRDLGSGIEARVTVNFALERANIFAPSGSTFDIIDINGRKLLTRETVEPSSTIDVAGWPTGVYIAHIRHKNGYAIRRFTLLR